jgi:hypothetical protein
MSKLNGGIIGPDNVPTGAFGSASGVWSLSDVTNYKKQGTWPVVLGGYQVANSCRFDTNAGMTKVAVAGTQTKATFSAWVKRSILGDESALFYSRIDANNHFLIRFTGDDKLELVNRVSGSNITFYTTNALYRDPSAWMHVLWSIDTTQASSGNRIKLFVNGTQVTSFATSTTQNQNTNLSANTTSDDYYVAQEYTSGDNYFDGYLAEVVWIDGTAYVASDFGETDSVTNNWVPKDVSGLTFGNSGFYLDFKDSSNLGNDANGGTDLTENNLTSIDQSVDTCTNNFATMNPLAPANISSASEGNLKILQSSSGGSVISTFGFSSGKWYWEVELDSQVNYTQLAGVIKESKMESALLTSFNVGANDGGWGYFLQGNSDNGKAFHNNTASSAYTTMSAGNILSIAVDSDNGKIFFAVNGTYVNSGDPANGTGAVYTNLPTGENLFPAITNYVGDGSTATLLMNFGSPPFSISSGNVDSSGMGNFEYAVPSGYYSLCTRNLNLIG